MDNGGEIICPLCERKYAVGNDFIMHLRNKPGHIQQLLAEFVSMKEEIAVLKDAIKAWR